MDSPGTAPYRNVSSRISWSDLTRPRSAPVHETTGTSAQRLVLSVSGRHDSGSRYDGGGRAQAFALFDFGHLVHLGGSWESDEPAQLGAGVSIWDEESDG